MRVILLFFIVLYFCLLLVLNLGQLQICQEYMSDLSLQACLGHVQAQPTLVSTTVLQLLPVHPINSRLNFNFELLLSIYPTSSRFNLKFQLLLSEAMKKTLVFIWIVLIAIASTMLWLLFLKILFF